MVIKKKKNSQISLNHEWKHFIIQVRIKYNIIRVALKIFLNNIFV
jgi:hypothetical protein